MSMREYVKQFLKIGGTVCHCAHVLLHIPP